ncbi:MAG: minor capsid protein [Armatimonadota bacterium]
MSLLIDQLAAYLQAQGEVTVGADLFCLHRPASPLACVSLHATGGYPPDRYTEREHPTVMLFARAATPGEALRKAYRLRRALHLKQNVDLGGGLWALTIEAMASPAYVGTEQVPEGLGHLASFNLLFDLRRPSS